LEKAWEHEINVYQLFIDFKQAYDSVDKTALLGIMHEMGLSKGTIYLGFLINLWNTTQISRHLKFSLFRSNVLFVLLYGCELRRSPSN
jgi:hypothetical protein